MALRPDVERTDSVYLLYALQSRHVRRSLLARNRGSTVPRLLKPDITGLLLPVPRIEEQRKIASILSSVDDAIEKTQAVIDQVQVVKRGLMQELLTRGLQGRHSRFKQTGIGEIPEEWSVERLDEHCEVLDHLRVPIKAADREGMRGSIPYYGASGIIDYVNEYIFDETLVLLAEDGANILTRNSPVAFKVEGKCWVNNHAHVFRPRPGVDADFLVEYLESLNYEKYSTGSAQPKLNRESVVKISVPRPLPDEQASIGELVRGLSRQKDAEKAVLDGLRTIKTALMASLLTGELRVTPDTQAA